MVFDDHVKSAAITFHTTGQAVALWSADHRRLPGRAPSQPNRNAQVHLATGHSAAFRAEMRQLNGFNLLHRMAGQMAVGVKPLKAAVAVLVEMLRDGLGCDGKGRKEAEAEDGSFFEHCFFQNLIGQR